MTERRKKAARWAYGAGLAAMLAMALVVMFMLTQATNNRELYERNYLRLLVINVVVATVLGMLILWIMARLLMRLRAGKFGSRLLVKLAAIFALVGVVPGLMIYVVSYQFVTRSIESWFDVKVEGALDAGLNLGRATLDALSSDLANKTRLAADQMADVPNSTAGLALERLRSQLGAEDVALWTSGGVLIANVGQSRYQINPERPGAQLLRLARSQRVVTAVEGLEDLASGAAGPAKVRALALVLPASSSGVLSEPRYLQVVQQLPGSLVANALAVQEANREYQERALARGGLRRMYIGTLTLSLFLSVFGATLLAVLLGNQLARPLLMLADGVRQVAAGDLTPKAALQGRDELGGLTRSFADMTRQLAEARVAVEQGLAQVDAARANLQTILDNLTAGVVVLSREGNVLSSNPGATRILRVPLAAYVNRPLSDIPGLEGFAASVLGQFEAFRADRHHHGPDHWQQSFELNAVAQSLTNSAITLIARGAPLPDDTRLLVFDDVSEMVSAQRAQAWGEVARRLAHEIKNPLTPIQLSAERLAMKLDGKVGPVEQMLVAKSVKTIVEQVNAMQRLVNEFRDYARLPTADLKPLNLNALVQEVLSLYGEEPGGTASSSIAIRSELDTDCPPIRGDAQQLRQVIHNLLQNAQDATEQMPHAGAVLIRTQWLPAGRRVRLSVLDSGAGFPDHILKRAFEPYVTTKAKGTGLGLAVVKKIADDHGARVDVSNRVLDGAITGAQVSLSFEVSSSPSA